MKLKLVLIPKKWFWILIAKKNITQNFILNHLKKWWNYLKTFHKQYKIP